MRHKFPIAPQIERQAKKSRHCRLKKLEATLNAWCADALADQTSKSLKISKNKQSKAKLMTDIHSRAFQLIRTHHQLSSNNKSLLEQPITSEEDNRAPRRSRGTTFSKQTADLLRRAETRQQRAEFPPRTTPEPMIVSRSECDIAASYIDFPLTQNFLNLLAEFGRLAALYVEICTDSNRIRSPILPQNNHVCLAKFGKAYEHRYNRLFSFIALKKVLAVCAAVLRVKVLRDSRGANDLNNYFVELCEFDSVAQYLDSRTDVLVDAFKAKIYRYLGTEHEALCDELGVRFDAAAERAWLAPFDADAAYDRLSYVFPVLDDYAEFLNTRGAITAELPTNVMSNKAKVDVLRVRILDKLRKRNAEYAALPLDGSRHTINKEMVLDVAEKLYALFQVRKVSNIFLATVVKHFEDKNCLGIAMDGQEVVTAIRRASQTMPAWLRIAEHKGMCLLKRSGEFTLLQVIKYISSHYKADN